jgi:hypothetical protein
MSERMLHSVIIRCSHLRVLVDLLLMWGCVAGDSAVAISPRPGGVYTQYGVRLAPQPFSPTHPPDGRTLLTANSAPNASPAPDESSAPDDNPVSQAVEEESVAPVSTSATHATPSALTEPLAVAVEEEDNDKQEDDEDDDMSTRRLSKALSPRVSAEPFNPEPPSPPGKPAPKPRATPTSLSSNSTPRSDVSGNDASPRLQEASPRKAERRMTANEIVAAASKRPSARDDDFPEPSPVSPNGDDDVMLPNDSSRTSRTSSSSSGTVDPVIAASRSPSGVTSPRDELLPVFAEAAKKQQRRVSPIPTPRAKPRSSSSASEGSKEMNGSLSPRSPRSPKENGTTSQSARQDKDVSGMKNAAHENTQEMAVVEVVHASAVTITEAAPPSPANDSSPKSASKKPPPVAPKPKRTPSDASDSSTQSSEPKNLPSPTMVASKLRDFADASAPTMEEQAANRQRVSSAARMFEQKATDSAKTNKVSNTLCLQTMHEKGLVSSVVVINISRLKSGRKEVFVIWP